LYYGPRSPKEVTNSMNAAHAVPPSLKAIPVAKHFPELQMKNQVFAVDYDMKQVEILMLSNGESYNSEKVPVITLYNNYFGGGMSGILFQDLRESKALAYSTYSRYNQPNKKSKHYYNVSYIGSQADKLSEALKGLSDLLRTLPGADMTFQSAKEMVLQEIRTERITKSGLLFNYLEALDLGNDHDVRKDIFEKVQKFTFDDIQKFQEQYISGKPTTILILGKKESLDIGKMEKYGPARFLTLQEVFGY
jgi:predicted Zn-dependent peptidase